MKKIAVIGAGITGAYSAYLLAKNGHNVMVFDGNTMPSNATMCNPGGINPLHGPGYPGIMGDFYLSSYHEHLFHRDDIQKLSGIDFNLRIIERIFLAFDVHEQSLLHKAQAAYNLVEGFEAHWMNAQELQKMEPRISKKALGGLFTKGNMSVNTMLLHKALMIAAEKLGVQFVCNDVTEIGHDEGRATHVIAGEERYEVESLFLCGGYGTTDLLAALGVSITITPIKGEMLLIRLAKPFKCDVTHGLTGLYHHTQNEYWLGGTRNDGDASGPSEEGKQTVLDNIHEMLSGFSEYEVLSHCAGARPATCDAIPIIGEVPGYTNVYVGSGSSSKGILLSAGIAREFLNYTENRTL